MRARAPAAPSRCGAQGRRRALSARQAARRGATTAGGGTDHEREPAAPHIRVHRGQTRAVLAWGKVLAALGAADALLDLARGRAHACAGAVNVAVELVAHLSLRSQRFADGAAHLAHLGDRGRQVVQLLVPWRAPAGRRSPPHATAASHAGVCRPVPRGGRRGGLCRPQGAIFASAAFGPSKVGYPRRAGALRGAAAPAARDAPRFATRALVSPFPWRGVTRARGGGACGPGEGGKGGLGRTW